MIVAYLYLSVKAHCSKVAIIWEIDNYSVYDTFILYSAYSLFLISIKMIGFGIWFTITLKTLSFVCN